MMERVGVGVGLGWFARTVHERMKCVAVVGAVFFGAAETFCLLCYFVVRVFLPVVNVVNACVDETDWPSPDACGFHFFLVEKVGG